MASSCTAHNDPPAQQVTDPSRVLQSVRVGLSSSANVESVSGTAVSVAADGASSTAATDYDTADVVGDLPVRTTLRYTAKDRSGSDLADLKGYTGPLQVDLTLENLTVAPRTVEYDVNGASRSDNALVGAPLTVAASATLKNVAADAVTAGSPDGTEGTEGTNGVLSTASDGSTVVQWATILAPPRSGASATLRLVADVKDFQVPSIDVAVQPGLSTDLSGDSVVSSALDADDSSQMALQRRTIDLVSDVNTVLTKAGASITDVRNNLDSSAKTLGVKTAGELRDNSKALASTMKSLKGQLGDLHTGLESATNATSSATTAQLEQAVSAMDSMLGDTSATPATAAIKGAGCQAQVAKPASSATVYSSLLTMSSQLDAYATVNAGCRDLVANAIRTTLGPAEPSAQDCVKSTSLTCLLYAEAAKVTLSLVSMVDKGDELVSALQPEVVGAAIDTNTAAARKLDALKQALSDAAATAESTQKHLQEQVESNGKSYAQTLDELEKALTAVDDAVSALDDPVAKAKDTVLKQLEEIGTAAHDAKDELAAALIDDRHSVKNQAEDLADELCRLSDNGLTRPGRLSAKQVQRLRGYLTEVPCEGKAAVDQNGDPVPPLKAPFPYSAPLSQRLDEEVAQEQGRWDGVAQAADPAAARQAFDDVETAVRAVKAAQGKHSDRPGLGDDPTRSDEEPTVWSRFAKARKASGSSVETSLQDITLRLRDASAEADDALTANGNVDKTLQDLRKQQEDVGKNLKAALQKLSSETVAEVLAATKTQARGVADIGDKASESIVKSFNRSIEGLKSTSDDVVKDAKGTVNQQRAELNQQSKELTGALDKTTEASLKGIAESTSASSKDVEGASTLLSSSLNKVLLDLGDRKVNGSGLLGSMTTNAAKAGTADYQMALASQNAEGYANIRSQDVSALLLRQAQFKASLTAADELPAFHLDIPSGAEHTTLYTLSIGGTR